MTQTTQRIGAVAVGSLLALSISGCSQLAEEAVEQAIENESGGDVEIDFDGDDGSLSITGENGEEVNVEIDEDGGSSSFSGTDEEGNTFEMTTGQGVPDDWPDDIPVPPGDAVSSTVMINNGERIITIITEVDDVAGANEDYVDQLSDAGFEIGSTSSFENDGNSSAFTEMTNDAWSVQINSTSDGTNDQMFVSIEVKDQ
jgi:hypothetical protein